MENSSLVEHLLRFALLGAEWVLWLLLGLFFFSLYRIGERFIVLLLFRRALRRYQEGQKDALAPYLPELYEDHLSAEQNYQNLARGIARLKRRLERGVPFLGTLGANAPYIGLFGTVLGIIQAFHQLSRVTGTQGTRLVMIGISEALVATGVGLLVAIPCVFAYNHLRQAVALRVKELEELLEEATPLQSEAHLT